MVKMLQSMRQYNRFHFRFNRQIIENVFALVPLPSMIMARFIGEFLIDCEIEDASIIYFDLYLWAVVNIFQNISHMNRIVCWK